MNIKDIKNFIHIKYIALINNLKSNITYYCIFQILFNLLFWYTDIYGINKFTGENFLPFYFRGIIFALYIIPMFITFRIVDSILNLTANKDSLLFTPTIVIPVLITTIILCNVPPLSNYFKRIFKIKNPKIEFIVNIILIGLVIYTGLNVGLFFRSN
jgi:hypothetical protein